MSKKKARKRHKPNVKPCANHGPIYSMIAEERMNRIARLMREALKNTGPAVELLRDEAAHLCKEVCRRRVPACNQVEE